MFKRVMGKASFCNIQDLQGNIQVYVARDAIGTDSYADFKKSDIGDILSSEICGSYHEPGQQECIHQTFPDP